MLEATGISKAFGPSKVLHHVNFSVTSGSIHALTGENGAGKSTLMKIIAGVHKPDEGQVKLKGKVLQLKSPIDALHVGISTVFQEFTLIPNLTIAENIFLGRELTRAGGAVDQAEMQKRSAVLLERVGLKLDPKTLVRNLAVAEQQMVEIAKGLSADADVFIFDEPTAALNSADVARLESLIRGLRDAGKAIIYISHRLNEIFGMCDTVTVLKDGRHIKTCPTAELDEHALVALMVGRELFEFFPPRSGKVGTQALVVEGLQTKDSGPRVNFALQRGEILGLAGLEGQGQREIARAVVGLTPLLAGEIRKFNLKDKQTIRLAPEAGIGKVIQQGVAFIPEDRKSEGLFLDLSIGENIALGTEVGKGLGTIAPNAKKIVSELMRAMKIGTGNSKAEVKSLSGGNQQKVLIGRWLASGVDILVIEEPTRGVDVGAKAEIYRLLREFTEKGGAVLVLSREAPELIGLCDRILIVHGQQIVDDLPATEATEHRILHSALKTKDAAAQVAA